jgi:hypothetical protein
MEVIKKDLLEKLRQAKAEKGFTWYWRKKFPDYKVSSEHSYFYLLCGLCHLHYWVSWDSLRAGTSRCCRECTKLPNEEKIQQIIAKHKPLWRVILPLSWKSVSDSKRRMFWMQCTCGKKQFVRWSKFSTGESQGCRTCMSRVRTHGLSGDPLYRTWRDLRSEDRPMCDEWNDFEKFRRWAKKLYSPDFKIIRYDKALPYRPDNCDYVPKNRRDIVITHRGGEILLPVGNITGKLSENPYLESGVLPLPGGLAGSRLPHYVPIS